MNKWILLALDLSKLASSIKTQKSFMYRSSYTEDNKVTVQRKIATRLFTRFALPSLVNHSRNEQV